MAGRQGVVFCDCGIFRYIHVNFVLFVIKNTKLSFVDRHDPHSLVRFGN